MSEPVLRMDAVSKSFGSIAACDKVSLDLRPGEIHALIGPNGAGKSTLIQQIAGRLKPDTGRIFFAEQDVTDTPSVARARMGMGRTFQVSALAMEYTVLENVMLGALGQHGSPFRFFRRIMSDHDLLKQATDALQRVGLGDHSKRRVAQLSHGQRRQLEVAIALTLKPNFFVMDEPMAGMGAEGSKALTGFLDGLREEAPILLVEHDMDAVFALADRVSVLVYGKVIATGTVEEIRTNKDVRTAYLGEQVA